VIPLTLAEVAAATGGRLAAGADGSAAVTGSVVVDSRAAGPGDLFVALPGERVDGHDFAAAAVRAGAVGVLGGRETGAPGIVVDDPQRALAELARVVVERLVGMVVVAVTGSSGKTSTKDLLRALLARLGPTIAPEGSFNNEIGGPLTALRAGAGTRYLVAEMGARMPGNIAYLCAVTPPDVAVVLNVGTAHLGVFGSRDVIARTKAELVEALRPGGVAVLNADDALVLAMAARTSGRVVWVGRGAGVDVRAVDVRLDDAARARFRLVTHDGSADVALALHGAHHVGNALAAAAVALELGLPLAEVAEVLGAAGAASRWRMEVTERADGLTVVNDAYNANPDSVRAALEALVAIGSGGAELDPLTGAQVDAGAGAAPARQRRTWAVLGEMLELGPDSVGEHESIGRLAGRLGISRLVAVGEGARPYHQGASHQRSQGPASGGDRSRPATPAGTQSCWLPDAESALALLAAEVVPGDVVLVKASRSIGLDRLVERLLREQSPGEQGPGAPVPARTGPSGQDDAQSSGPEEESAP
jgi:UDP-N-acetylmuramoyl-tripeptide--D-alanyl-D-alanine ligase